MNKSLLKFWLYLRRRWLRLPYPMEFFSIVWVLRVDPKDPNTVPGMNLLVFTSLKMVRNAWLADGVSLKYFGYLNPDNQYVRIKWYFPCLVLCARRNPK